MPKRHRVPRLSGCAWYPVGEKCRRLTSGAKALSFLLQFGTTESRALTQNASEKRHGQRVVP